MANQGGHKGVVKVNGSASLPRSFGEIWESQREFHIIGIVQGSAGI